MGFEVEDYALKLDWRKSFITQFLIYILLPIPMILFLFEI